MSTISEVDIRDWDHVNLAFAKEVADEVNLETGSEYFQQFVEQIELIRNKQIQSVAALLRRPE